MSSHLEIQTDFSGIRPRIPPGIPIEISSGFIHLSKDSSRNYYNDLPKNSSTDFSSDFSKDSFRDPGILRISVFFRDCAGFCDKRACPLLS